MRTIKEPPRVLISFVRIIYNLTTAWPTSGLECLDPYRWEWQCGRGLCLGSRRIDRLGLDLRRLWFEDLEEFTDEVDCKVGVLELVGSGESELDIGELGGQRDDCEFGGLGE